jgi:hypothetical protein
MARNAYGQIVVGGDFEGDLYGISRALSQWEFDTQGEIQFEVHDGEIYGTAIGEYPTAWPNQTFVKTKEGKRIPRRQADPSSIANMDCEMEGVHASVLCSQVASLLSRGYLEISAASNDKYGAYYGRLTINANGRIEYEGREFISGRPSYHITETFDPNDPNRPKGPLAALVEGPLTSDHAPSE